MRTVAVLRFSDGARWSPRMVVREEDGHERMIRGGVALLFAAIFFLVPASLYGQGTTGAILGTVFDTSDAVVAGALVTVTHAETGLTRSIATSGAGDYRLEFLPVGRYTVVIAAPGFSTFEQTGAIVVVTQSTRIDATLNPAGVTQSVSVTGATPLVNTNSAEVGTTVESAMIAELPIVNRNVYTLLDIAPGVQQNSNQVGLGLPEQHTSMGGGVEAGYSGSVNYLLDGGSNVGSLRNSGNILPNPDAVGQFRILENSYSAEYGRFPGGVISVITKSGTNDFHGALFEFWRNNDLDANNWGSTLPPPPLNRNQFGFTLGGPVRRNKTFFFGSLAGLRQQSSTFVNTAVLPTALERSGNFSQSVNAPVDPLTLAPFPNSVIPVSRMDPVALKMLSSYVPATANGPGNTYQANISTPKGSEDVLGKIDYQISVTQRLTGSYFNTGGFQWSNSGSSPLPYSRLKHSWRQQNLNVSETWSKGRSMVNEAGFVYTRAFGARVSYPQTSLHDLGSTYQMQGAPSLPSVAVNGYFSLGQQISGPRAGNSYYAARDVVSTVKGRHNLRFGGEVSFNHDEQFTNLNNFGNVSFNGSITGNGFADFLLGIPSSIGQDQPVSPETRSWTTSAFVQDDYRLARLTLNLGLRWDVQTPPTDPLNRQAAFVPGQHSTVHSQMPTGLVYPGDEGIPRGIARLSFAHLAPRAGFAWDVFGDGKTSIRGAFGLFWGTVSGNGWNAPSNFLPFTVSLSFPNAGSVTGATLSDPYRNYPGGNPFPYTGSYIIGSSVKTIARDFTWPHTEQANLSVQRQLTSNLSAMAAYIGSIGGNLPFLVDRNYPVATATATSSGANVLARRPIPTLGQVQNLESIASSRYHALQLSTTGRLTHGVSLTANYVYSQTHTSAGIQNTTLSAQDYNNVILEEGRADTDMRHVFNLAAVWRPNYPQGGNRFATHALNGWQISLIVKVRSGLPLTITNGVDANLDGNSTDRAHMNGNPNLAHPSAAQWFNTAAFSQNPVVTGHPVNGNSGRNIVSGPGFRAVDLLLARTFQLARSVNLQVRAEGSNVLNTVNLGVPGTNVSAPSSFGIIRSAQAMRQLQLGVRLVF